MADLSISFFATCELTLPSEASDDEIGRLLESFDGTAADGARVRFEFSRVTEWSPWGGDVAYRVEAWAEYIPEDTSMGIDEAAEAMLRSEFPMGDGMLAVRNVKYGGRSYGPAGDRVTVEKRVSSQGNSLVVCITKEAMAMGLGRGDRVIVTLERVPGCGR